MTASSDSSTCVCPCRWGPGCAPSVDALECGVLGREVPACSLDEAQTEARRWAADARATGEISALFAEVWGADVSKDTVTQWNVYVIDVGSPRRGV